MSKYMRSGNNFTPVVDTSLHASLGGNTYAVQYDERSNTYSLNLAEPFRVPSKMYGNINAMTKRIVQTFNERNKTTGVLLSGVKGSGKTLLAKSISIQMATEGVPTILVNSEFSGETFNTFIQSITERAVVIFDEFEKIYDKEHQEEVLTLLDGTVPSNKMYILTCNDISRIDKNMANRPGRVYYNLEYASISKEDVIDYCQNNLADQSQIDVVVDFFQEFNVFTFDMLTCLIEEMNRFGETPQEAAQYINVNLSKDVGLLFDVEVFDINTNIPVPVKFSSKKASYLPSTYEHLYIYFKDNTNEDEDDSESDSYVRVLPEQVISKSAKRHVYNTGKYRVVLTATEKIIIAT